MKYSLVNNSRVEAFKGGKGFCLFCGEPTIAKCGTKNINHWAHRSNINCDPWWENETEWHRNWKDCFPKEWQEIIHFDELTGEKHIADIKTSKGLVIELQNSPISPKELESRENFYKNMIWIINGEHFKNNFYILHILPDPKAEFVQDIAFIDSRKGYLGASFFRYSENETYFEKKSYQQLVLVHSVDEICNEIETHFIGHYIYDWIKPRSVWFESKCRRFIDFGDEYLWELIVYDKRGLKCIRRYDKNHFLRRAND